MGMPTHMWFNHRAMAILRGAKVKVVRRSQKTGSITVEMTEDRGAYRKGEQVLANAWELAERDPSTKGAR